MRQKIGFVWQKQWIGEWARHMRERLAELCHRKYRENCRLYSLKAG
jgi:hypothetical protein